MSPSVDFRSYRLASITPSQTRRKLQSQSSREIVPSGQTYCILFSSVLISRNSKCVLLNFPPPMAINTALCRQQVVYNNDVVVFGTPLLTLRVGDAPDYNRRAVYSSGSGTSALIFEYVVQVNTTTTLKINDESADVVPCCPLCMSWVSKCSRDASCGRCTCTRTKPLGWLVSGVVF